MANDRDWLKQASTKDELERLCEASRAKRKGRLAS
jgi:hypothetical protein